MSAQRLSRREFLRLGALTAGTAALAACAAPAPAPAPQPTQAAPAAAPKAEPTKAPAPTSAPAAAAKGGTLRVYWHPAHHYETYKQVATKFEADTGWKTNWELYQWPDMRTKLLANFAAGDVPDLSEEPGNYAQEFGLSGNALNITPFIQKSGKEMGYPDDWQEAAVKQYMVKGDHYGVKLHHTCTLLFYNMEMFDKAGIKPESLTSWEAFLDACKATAKGNVFGFAPNQSSGYTWPWLHQNGQIPYDPVKNVVPLDNPDAYEAMQFQADLIHKHKVAPIPVTSADYEGPQKLFSAKRSAIILTGPWDVKPVLDSSPDLKWGMIQPLKRKVQATTGAGAGMFIPKAAKNPAAAFDFIKAVTTIEAEIAATKEANMLMPRKSWAANPEVMGLKYIAPFAQALKLVVDTSALTLTGKSGEIGNLFNKMYEEVIYKNRPAEEALKEYVAAANKVLAG